MDRELARSLLISITEGKSALFLGREVPLQAGVPAMSIIANALGAKFGLSEEVRHNINLVVNEIEKAIPDGRKRIVEDAYGMIEPVSPSGILKYIPLLRWKAIYTWGVDSLIEKAYEECFSKAIQSISVITEAVKVVSINDLDNVCLLKMYGSIRDPLNKKARLVLTRQDDVATQQNRFQLLSTVKDIYPPLNLLFVGFNVDQDFLTLLAHLQDMTYGTSDAVIITPQELDEEGRGELKDLRCQVLKTNPADFFEMALSSRLSEPSIREKERSIFAVVEAKENVEINYADYKKLSSEILVFCEHEFDKDRKRNAGKPAKDFYEGEEIWLSGLEQGFPVERDVLSSLLEAVERDLSRETGGERFSNRIFALLYDHPGAGGTTALQMLGYAIYRQRLHIVLMVRSKRMSPRLDFDAIVRFCESLPTKPLILIDDLSKDKDNFRFLFTLFDSRRTPATFVICCRQKEWDEDYYIGLSYFDEDHPKSKDTMQQMNEDKLPLKELGLKGHARLFLLSEKVSPREKYELFRKTVEAGVVRGDVLGEGFEQWQSIYDDDILLVLLYRIFKNAKLEFVVIDEYQALEQRSAQAAYAYAIICALNALKLDVSWELLRRTLSCDWSVIFELPKVFGNVVRPDFQFDTNLFRARHQLIAEKLFGALYHQAEKQLTLFEEIIRNVSPNNEYERNLLRQIVLNKKLHDELGRLSYSSRIFEAARDIVPYDPVVIQHLGITLMKMGRDEDAEAAYKTALEFHPENPAVYNSEGILFEKMAFKMLSQSEPDEIRGGVYLRKAGEAFRKSILYGRDTEHGYDRYGRFLLKSSRLFRKGSPQWQEHVGMVRGLIEDARDNVSEIKLKFIDDLEARFKAEIGDTEGAIALCKDLLRADPSIHAVRYNLSWLLFKTREYQPALDVLKPSIDEEVKEFRFYKLYARLLSILRSDHLKEIKRILEAANELNPEDLYVNFQLAVVYYREAELGKAFSYFRNCDSLSYKRPDRFKVKLFFQDNGQKKRFFGTIKSRIHATRGYITRDLWGDDIFFNPSRNPTVENGQRVRFYIGFCYVGPQALDVIPEHLHQTPKT